MALIGLALVGGAVSKGDWLGVSASLNGALKGYMDGNHEVAQREYDDYQRKFDAAKQQQNQIDKQFDSVLNNRSLTINDQLQKIQVIAAQHGLDDVAMQAKQKSIDGIIKQVEARRTQLLGIVQRKEAVDDRIQGMLTVSNSKNGNGLSGEQQTAAIDTAAWDRIISGKNPASNMAWKVDAQIADIAKKQGVSTQKLLSLSAQAKSTLQALRFSEARFQNMERAENIIDKEIPVFESAMRDIELPNLPIAARGKIKVLRSLGDPSVTKLDQSAHVVLNEFQQIINSNPGALHVSDVSRAEEEYKNIQTTEQAKAWISGAKRIITNAREGAAATRQDIAHRLNGLWGVNEGDKQGGGVIVPAVPSYHPEKEQRYQEWKKQHGGG